MDTSKAKSSTKSTVSKTDLILCMFPTPRYSWDWEDCLLSLMGFRFSLLLLTTYCSGAMNPFAPSLFKCTHVYLLYLSLSHLKRVWCNSRSDEAVDQVTSYPPNAKIQGERERETLSSPTLPTPLFVYFANSEINVDCMDWPRSYVSSVSEFFE